MKNRSLNFKMIFVMGILLAGSLSITGIGLSKLGHMNDAIHALVHEKSARVSLIKDIRGLFYIQLINEKNYILVEDKKDVAIIEERMNKRHDELLKKIDELIAISTEVGKEELTKFKAVYGTWWENSQELRRHVQAGNKDEASKISTVANRDLRLNGEAIIDSTVDRNEKKMQEEVIHMSEQYKEARLMMLLATALSMIIGGGIAGIVLYKLSKSINGVISNLTLSSREVSSASDQIATAATELSEATTEQAASLEESVATIEELSSMVKINSENAAAAAKLSSDTSEIAKRGEGEMNALSQSMTDIAADSKKINDIIAVIDDIAFQTNLLALNAAVEAARAGEQGKGFAVVAEAVRALSQRSSAAAKDIGELIRSSVTRIDTGSGQAQKSAAVLAEILNSVIKVSALNQEISSASMEQSNGIEQISKALNQLDQTTQINAASSEEAAASSEELAAQAESLSNVIQELAYAIRGQSHAEQNEITVPQLSHNSTPLKRTELLEKAG
ncbi:methyl-accepting chemotaxis protein [Bdellovibrio sp. ZAP7]|uniref:methyl-accepting chemotaxis protein n=1 Tax=Bdellovibrio sp. ZAP7 TaxID=2231053 RepID=UPI00143DDFD8|nr:methyl-accepting chemotaxis protein [Bdellovibrio sp. ZAP7]